MTRKIKVNQWTITQHDAATLREELAKCKPGSRKAKMIQAELDSRKPNGERMTITDWLG